MIVDADTADEKFFQRFAFFGGSQVLHMNGPKVRAVAATAKARGKMVIPVNAMADEKFDFRQIADRYVIIAVDTAQAREVIEGKLRAIGCTNFVHVGCNLNSVSIFGSMRDVISDDPPADAQTSYDVVPDVKTYLRAAADVAALFDQPVKVWIDDDVRRPTT
jgi:hypothetical protein